MYRLRQCVHNYFAVVAYGRNPGFFMLLTMKEGSSFSACPGSHAFVYIRVVMKRKLTSTLYIERSGNSTAIIAGWLRMLAEQGTGLEQISQTKPFGVRKSK